MKLQLNQWMNLNRGENSMCSHATLFYTLQSTEVLRSVGFTSARLKSRPGSAVASTLTHGLCRVSVKNYTSYSDPTLALQQE